MNWRMKAAAFRVLDALPHGADLHYYLQRRVTRTLPQSPAALDTYWDVAKSMLATFAQHDAAGCPTEILEIGAGCDLAAPLAFRMLGVARVVASDVQRLARIDLVHHAARHMAGKAGRDAPPFDTWAELDAFGITYRAPDSVVDRYPDTFQCSCSNAVLEHVPSEQLSGLMRGLKAATRPGGLSIHLIDYSDHFARSDGRLSRFNFLKFTDRQWKKYNSGLQHVNRLRHGDYLRFFREAGFTVIEEMSQPGEPAPEIRANLAPRFRAYDERDLFSLDGRIVAMA
jgi:hypothetical protein